MRPHVAGAAVTVLLLTLSGCGGSDTAPATGGAVASAGSGSGQRATGGYAGGFEAVTDGFRLRSQDLQSRVDTSTTDLDQIVAIYTELRDIAKDSRLQYGALAAPTEVQSVHQRILQLFDRQVALLDELVEAARAGDQPSVAGAVQGLTDLTNDFEQARRDMEAALAACGSACTT